MRIPVCVLFALYTAIQLRHEAKFGAPLYAEQAMIAALTANHGAPAP